jgi:hypothetical protein
VTTSEVTPSYRTRLEQILETEGRKQRWLLARVNETLEAQGQDTISRSYLSSIVGGYHAGDAIRAAVATALGREIGDVFPSEIAA